MQDKHVVMLGLKSHSESDPKAYQISNSHTTSYCMHLVENGVKKGTVVELEKTKWLYNIVNALIIHLKTVNFVIWFQFNKREKKEEVTAGAGQASGKARQISQTTLGPANLRESDVEVNKQEKVSESVFLFQQRLLTPLFSILYFLHSYYSLFMDYKLCLYKTEFL